MYQRILFDPEDIFRQPLKKYELSFSLLDLSCLELPRKVGRKPISNAALARALIFKNLKTNIRYRFCKEKPPKNDPDCQLGIFPTFPSGKKNVQFFWGYRNHIINDVVS